MSDYHNLELSVRRITMANYQSKDHKDHPKFSEKTEVNISIQWLRQLIIEPHSSSKNKMILIPNLSVALSVSILPLVLKKRNKSRKKIFPFIQFQKGW